MTSPHNAFCDTSFFFAALTHTDPNHHRAREFLRSHTEMGLATTWDVASETITLLRYRGGRTGYALAIQFIDKLVPELDLISCHDDHRREALAVFHKFGKDKRLSFCDCLSFVVMTQLRPELGALTFDKDFRSFGLPVLC